MTRLSSDFIELLEKRNGRGTAIRKACTKANQYRRIIIDKRRLMLDEIYNVCAILGQPDDYTMIQDVVDLSAYRWACTKDTITIKDGGEDAFTVKLHPFFSGIAELDSFENTVVAAVMDNDNILLYILDKDKEL